MLRPVLAGDSSSSSPKPSSATILPKRRASSSWTFDPRPVRLPCPRRQRIPLWVGLVESSHGACREGAEALDHRRARRSRYGVGGRAPAFDVRHSGADLARGPHLGLALLLVGGPHPDPFELGLLGLARGLDRPEAVAQDFPLCLRIEQCRLPTDPLLHSGHGRLALRQCRLERLLALAQCDHGRRMVSDRSGVHHVSFSASSSSGSFPILLSVVPWLRPTPSNPSGSVSIRFSVESTPS